MFDVVLLPFSCPLLWISAHRYHCMYSVPLERKKIRFKGDDYNIALHKTHLNTLCS